MAGPQDFADFGVGTALTNEPPITEPQPNLTISVVIPTRNRPAELADLLSSILGQTQQAHEIIVIDDSKERTTAELVHNAAQRATPKDATLLYLRGDGRGNTSARNIGIDASTGDAILFLDDDTLLEPNVIEGIARFLLENPHALGVQPKIPGFADYWAAYDFGVRLENLAHKAALLTYHEPNRLTVRRSGAAIYPSTLNKMIPVQRMLGCGFCLRRSVLKEFIFDTNLRRWGCYDDLDLTYRIYRKYPGTLFAIPEVRVIHRHSKEARLPSRALNRMSVVYWFYVFFKDFSDISILNTLSFLWAMSGFVFWTVIPAIVNRDGNRLRLTTYLISDYAISLRHLKSIIRRDLDFFNSTIV